MSIKIGDIDIANEIVELHFQNIRTQLIIEDLLRQNPTLRRPDQDRLRAIEENAFRLLQEKFPNMGLTRKQK
jgi:hypothetical protein